MTRNEAFKVLELFKSKAKVENDLYDAYHGKKEPIVLWFIYNGPEDTAEHVAVIRFEDIFPDEQYLVEIMINQKLFQLFDFKAATELVDSIQY